MNALRSFKTRILVTSELVFVRVTLTTMTPCRERAESTLRRFRWSSTLSHPLTMYRFGTALGGLVALVQRALRLGVDRCTGTYGIAVTIVDGDEDALWCEEIAVNVQVSTMSSFTAMHRYMQFAVTPDATRGQF